MSDIVLTAGVRANLLQLQSTAATITNTQSKLATGKRVNSALDNPINFFTAQGLSNQTSFLRPIVDGTIHATARRRHRGRTTWVWEVEITDDRQRLCALVRMTIAVRERLVLEGDAPLALPTRPIVP